MVKWCKIFALEEPRKRRVQTTASFSSRDLTFTFITLYLVCVHRRNPYIRFIYWFQYGRLLCDGSRFLYYNYALYCNCWEPPILTSEMFTSDRVLPGLPVTPVLYRTENWNNTSISCYNKSLKDERKWITPHLFLWKLGTAVYYSPSLIALVNDAFIFLLMMLLYHTMILLHNLCKYHWNTYAGYNDIKYVRKSPNPHLCSHFQMSHTKNENTHYNSATLPF